MKKYRAFLFAVAFVLNGCSFFSPLNPFDGEEETATGFQPNDYLWQAALDKTAFMKLAEENRAKGLLVTDWQEMKGVPGEMFKLEIRVSSDKLRADCLQVKVLKKVRRGNEWEPATPDPRLRSLIEREILERSRVLYRKSLEINED